MSNSATSFTNGNGPAHDRSPAAALLEQHEASQPHAPTVEDEVDEEDKQHPPPSAQPKGSGVALDQSQKPKGPIVPDTSSNELFPELGSVPKPSPNIASSWNNPSKARAAPMKQSNGFASHASSGTSSPRSGFATPGSTVASARAGPAITAMPNRYTNNFTMLHADMKAKGQLKKSLPEVVRDIERRTKARITMRASPEGGIQFEASGTQSTVDDALRSVFKELSVKRSIVMRIPSSVRPFIIGQQGRTIQAISKDTGANIQLPKLTPNTATTGDDDEEIDITLEGDGLSLRTAQARIQAIVNERTANQKQRLKSIPPEFYPFIGRIHGSRSMDLQDGAGLRINVPEYHTWTRELPLQPIHTDGRLVFKPHVGPMIELSGDRDSVQQVRAEIEQQVEQLERSLTYSALEVARDQHQFIIGEQGLTSEAFYDSTGCAIIFPPSQSAIEDLIVIGPKENINAGLEQAIELATSMKQTSFDIARLYSQAGAANHAQHLGRYLRQRPEIPELEKQFNSRIAIPSGSADSNKWTIFSREGSNCLRVKTELQNIIRGIPPSRVLPVEVDPFFHRHLETTTRDQLLKNHGVRALFPGEKDDNQNIVFVYEGPFSSSTPHQLHRQAPSAAEEAEFERALANAQAQIAALELLTQAIVTKSMDVPRKHVDRTKRYVSKQQSNLPEGSFPVNVRPAPQTEQLSGSEDAVDTLRINLRGTQDAVESLSEKILQFIEQEKADEKERGHVTTFPFPQKYANMLIGKRGESINKLRDEFDVDIRVAEGSIDIKGPVNRAQLAKTRILNLLKRLEDEATYTLKIKPQYHRDLIGAKGNLVNKLQDRYDVKINFPRNAPANGADDSRSVAESESDGGASRRANRPSQASDEVVIRGPKKGADAAREEILSLLQYTIENSHVASVLVARGQLPVLIGQGGREMENLRLTTGASIDVVDNRKDDKDPKSRVEIKLKGSKKQVEEARKLLEGKAKVFDDTIIRTISVDKKYHKALIGSAGTNIRDIVVAAGGSGDRRDLARTVRFPGVDSADTTIKIEAPTSIANAIHDSIASFVSERADQITDFVDVPPDQHRLLIGKGGDAKRALESRFGVSINVPRQGQADSQVKVTGKSTAVQTAISHIESLIKDNKGLTVNVPTHLHHQIVDGGQFISRLKSDYKVTVDHAGVALPPKTTKTPAASLPLITDAANGAPSWHIADLAQPSDDGATIPWVLRGSEESVSSAKARLEAAIAENSQASSVGYLRLPNPRSYRFIIGHAGSKINSIRKQTGTKITVPREHKDGDSVEIIGTRDGVLRAKDIILECVEEGESGRNRRSP